MAMLRHQVERFDAPLIEGGGRKSHMEQVEGFPETCHLCVPGPAHGFELVPYLSEGAGCLISEVLTRTEVHSMGVLT